MNGSLTQRPVSSTPGSVCPTPGLVSAAYVNSFRVKVVTERLAMHVRPGNRADPSEFFGLCISLARGIDYAVANNEIPHKVHDLPALLKQVYNHRKSEMAIQAAIMVLMISVKNACKSGWFVPKDTDELMALANEIARSFSSPADTSIEPASHPPIISQIMSRFFPRTKMGRILVSLEVKSGFEAYVVDFHILKNTIAAGQEKIWLFVAQTDNISTSACLVSPPQVNFLLNGKGVDRRINISMDPGPQFPTDVTPMLKYGANLLQAIGQFNGNYIITIAFMTTLSPLDVPVLQDYVQPIATSLESDSEITEGASRISLNCPISFRRIKTPVKGHLCKHRQCFDYGNYIDMNSRRPSWRCPHCNQSVCYLDMRIDQNMVKVLREVGENVADVIISSDGSWKSVLEGDDHTVGTDDLHEKNLGQEQDGSDQIESVRFSNSQANIVDLTMGGSNENDAMDTCEVVDRKPSKDALCGFSVANNPTVMSNPTMTSNPTMPMDIGNTYDVAQNAFQTEDDFWAGIYLTASASNGFAAPNISDSPNTNLSLTPVLADTISPALNRDSADVHMATHTPMSQSLFSPLSNLQLQQASQVGNVVYDFGRAIPRNINRNPIAVQALPAQSLVTNSTQRSRPSSNATPSQTSPTMSPRTDTFNMNGGETERQHQFSRSLINPLSASDISSSSMQHHPPMTQNWDHQDYPYMPSRSFQQQIVGLPAPGAYRGGSSGLERQNSQHMRLPQMNLPAVARQSTQYPSMQVPQGVSGHGNPTIPSNRFTAAVQRSTQRSISPPSVPVQLQAPRVGSSYPMNVDGLRTSLGEERGCNMGGMTPPISTPDGMGESPCSLAEQNWRPSGRMRGALSGPAYSAAFNQFVIRPPQAPSGLDLTSPNVQAQLQALLSNNVNSHGQQQ